MWQCVAMEEFSSKELNYSIAFFPGYFISPTGDGCQECMCDPLGTQSGVPCNSTNGQCVCRGGDSGVTGMQCDSCLPGYFNFDASLGR